MHEGVVRGEKDGDGDGDRDRGRDRDRTGWRLHGGAPIPYFPPQRTSAFSFCARFSMR